MKLMLIRAGFLFCQEKSEDESIVLVKYRIDK